MYRGDKGYPRQERMQYRWEFDQVKKHGLSFAGKLIVLSIVEHKQMDGRRIGYVITKRIGPAILRNRIKRKLREIYRLHRAFFNDGISIVIIARPAAVKASYMEFSKEFLNLYQSARKSLWDTE
mgnify:CR=1 FL=1